MTDITTVLLDVLFAVVTAAVLVLWAKAAILGRKRRVVVADVANGSGEPKLDACTVGLSALLRIALRAELPLACQALRWVAGAPFEPIAKDDRPLRAYPRRDGSLFLSLPETHETLRWQGLKTMKQYSEYGSSKAELRSVQDEAPIEGMPSDRITNLLSALSGLLARPRAINLRATLVRSQVDGSSRLGLAIEISSAGPRPDECQTFWEPEGAPDSTTRATTLITPAARWTAAILAGRTIGAERMWRRQEAKIVDTVGVLMEASARDHPGFAKLFLDSAVREYEAAETIASRKKPGGMPALLREDLAAAHWARARLSRDKERRFHVKTAQGQWSALHAMAQLELQGLEKKMQAGEPQSHQSELREQFDKTAEREHMLHIQETLADLYMEDPTYIRAALDGLGSASAPIGQGITSSSCLPSLELYREAAAYAAGARLSGSTDMRGRAGLLLGAAIAMSSEPDEMCHRALRDPDFADINEGIELFTAKLAAIGGPVPVWGPPPREVLDRVVRAGEAAGWPPYSNGFRPDLRGLLDRAFQPADHS